MKADISSSHYMKLLQALQPKQETPVVMIKHQPPQQLAQIAQQHQTSSRQNSYQQSIKSSQNTIMYLSNENLKLKKQADMMLKQLQSSSNAELVEQRDKLEKLRAAIEQKNAQSVEFQNSLQRIREEKRCLQHYLDNFLGDRSERKTQLKAELSSELDKLRAQLSQHMELSMASSFKCDDYQQQNSLLLSQKRELAEETQRLSQIHDESERRIHDLQHNIGENVSQLEELENIMVSIQVARESQKYKVVEKQKVLRVEQNKKAQIQRAVNALNDIILHKQEKLQDLHAYYQTLEHSLTALQKQLSVKGAETEGLIAQKCEISQRLLQAQETFEWALSLIQTFANDAIGDQATVTRMSDVSFIFDQIDSQYSHLHIQEQQVSDSVNTQYMMEVQNASNASDSKSFEFADQFVRSESCPAQIAEAKQITGVQKLLNDLSQQNGRQMNVTVDAATLSQLKNMMQQGRLSGILGNFEGMEFSVVDKRPRTQHKQLACECDSTDSAWPSDEEAQE